MVADELDVVVVQQHQQHIAGDFHHAGGKALLCNLIHHGDGTAVHGQLQGGLTPRQASAAHHYAAAHLDPARIHIQHIGHIGAVQSGNGRPGGFAAHRHYDGVRMLGHDQLRSGLGVQADVRTALGRHPLQPLGVSQHVVLKVQLVDVVEQAA